MMIQLDSGIGATNIVKASTVSLIVKSTEPIAPAWAERGLMPGTPSRLKPRQSIVQITST